jgi:hypothetical protein
MQPSNIKPGRWALMMVGYAFCALHLQLWYSSTGIYVWASTSTDRWNKVCHYYTLGKIEELQIKLTSECPNRVSVTAKGHVVRRA